LLPREFSIDGGELTPKLSVKRKVVEQKYKDEIDRMYEGAAA
jgi:long-chain acyl-CoA synthetase